MMKILSPYYSIKSLHHLKEYLKIYTKLVEVVAKHLGVNLKNPKIKGDHLGVQVLSKKEFKICSEKLTQYSTLINESIIHERRVRIYRLNKPLKINSFSFSLIEIFEPKPGADLKKLKPGVEHLAFKVDDYEEFLARCKKNNLPLDKEGKNKNLKFFKTRLLDLVEIEFRNKSLGAESLV